MGKLIDLTGTIIGDIEILGEDIERNEIEYQRFLNGEVKRSKKYLKCKCLKCGEEFSRAKDNIKNNRTTCPMCSLKERGLNHRKDEYDNKLLKYFVPMEKYTRTKDNHIFKCKRCNTIFISNESSLIGTKHCYNCKPNKKYNIDSIKKYTADKIENIFTKNGKTYFKLICNNNHQYSMWSQDIKSGKKCPYCTNKKVLKGYNDVATTHQNIVKYFLNKEDATKYTYGSEKKVDVICPNCGFIKKMRVNQIIRYDKVTCENCSDGISYPEKFMSQILKELRQDFVTQKIFDWAKNKRYDFYIETLSLIIEVHGLQHYKDTNWATHKEQINNDKEKEELALKNGILNYIQLDCRVSNKYYIIESINSQNLFNNLFNINNVDFEKCSKQATSSMAKKIIREFYKGNKPQDIIKQNEFSQTTVYRYLRGCEKYNYTPSKERKLVCIELNIIFNSRVDIIRYIKINHNKNISVGSISRSCENKTQIECNDILFIDENIVFKTLSDVVKYIKENLNIDLKNRDISRVALGNRNNTRNLHFKYINNKKYSFRYYNPETDSHLPIYQNTIDKVD